MRLHDAIFKLNSNIVTIRGEIAYDINENIIEYDLEEAKKILNANKYKDQRANEYPDFKEYLDGIVKGDQQQIDKYIADCLAVKAKYPKE